MMPPGSYTVCRFGRVLSLVIHTRCHTRPGPLVIIEKLRYPGEYAVTVGSLFIVLAVSPGRNRRGQPS